jgi:glucose-1-phosphate cytidylyltransferase
VAERLAGLTQSTFALFAFSASMSVNEFDGRQLATLTASYALVGSHHSYRAIPVIQERPMKVVILAGGYGTRLSEHTSVVPKPLVEIGGRPIIWHIMKLFSHHGLNEFVICLGYKGQVIRDYFLNYFPHQGDLTIDLQRNRIETHRNECEPWKVTLVDTGEKTMTGGRLKRVRDYLGGETFCMTYGDGVSDVDIRELIRFHHQQGALATVTAVQQPGRFGAINLSSDRPRAARFREKDARDGQVINGGFFVMEPQALDVIDGDATSWENEPLARLIERDQLAVYSHRGYWQNMDTLRDKTVLQELWDTGNPPWCVWNKDSAAPSEHVAAIKPAFAAQSNR